MYHYSHPEARKGRSSRLESSPRIHLIDSGMDNNCPTYVLLHPSRKTDVIINMDASSDVQNDTFQERLDQIGSRRGLEFTKRHEIKPGLDLKERDHSRVSTRRSTTESLVLARRPLSIHMGAGSRIRPHQCVSGSVQ